METSLTAMATATASGFHPTKGQVGSLPSNSGGRQEPLPGASGFPFHSPPSLGSHPSFPASPSRGESQQLPTTKQALTAPFVIYATTGTWDD